MRTVVGLVVLLLPSPSHVHSPLELAAPSSVRSMVEPVESVAAAVEALTLAGLAALPHTGPPLVHLHFRRCRRRELVLRRAGLNRRGRWNAPRVILEWLAERRW